MAPRPSGRRDGGGAGGLRACRRERLAAFRVGSLSGSTIATASDASTSASTCGSRHPSPASLVRDDAVGVRLRAAFLPGVEHRRRLRSTRRSSSRCGARSIARSAATGVAYTPRPATAGRRGPGRSHLRRRIDDGRRHQAMLADPASRRARRQPGTAVVLRRPRRVGDDARRGAPPRGVAEPGAVAERRGGDPVRRHRLWRGRDRR